VVETVEAVSKSEGFMVMVEVKKTLYTGGGVLGRVCIGDAC